MNLKRRLLLSTAALSAVTLALVSPNYSEGVVAQETNLPQLDRVAQILWQLGDNDRPVAVVDRAIYSLDHPAFQFIYSPNQFVIEAFTTDWEDTAQATINRISIWSKEDYVTLKNAGEEVGDFAPRLTISIHGNPEGLPLVDFVTTRRNEILNPDVESFERKSIAGQEGLSFTYSDTLWSYQSTVVKDVSGDQVIMISLGGPKTESRAAAGSVGYYGAFEKIEESLKLTNASVDEYKLQDHSG